MRQGLKRWDQNIHKERVDLRESLSKKLELLEAKKDDDSLAKIINIKLHLN